MTESQTVTTTATFSADVPIYPAPFIEVLKEQTHGVLVTPCEGVENEDGTVTFTVTVSLD